MPSCYDVLAPAYLKFWEPVLAPAGLELLDRCEGLMPELCHGESAHVVDIGTGAGFLPLKAAPRWGGARFTATDSSAGMLEAGRARVRDELSPTEHARIEFVEAPADRLPLADASADLVMASFVYQLVPDRPAAIREARRLLRPGGRLGLVTWVADATPFPPADAFDDALDALSIELPREDADQDGGGVSGDYRSVATAARQLRRAGFSSVSTAEGWVDHTWDPGLYLECQEHLWESDLFSTLSEERRVELRDEARRRLRQLSHSAFRWRAPIVFAFGRRR